MDGVFLYVVISVCRLFEYRFIDVDFWNVCCNFLLFFGVIMLYIVWYVLFIWFKYEVFLFLVVKFYLDISLKVSGFIFVFVSDVMFDIVLL